jgi:hypothetical protein
VHAALLGLVFTALHTGPVDCPAGNCGVPIYQPPPAPAGIVVEKLAEPPEVNLRAQGELKQQNCQPCAPTYVTPSHVVPTYVMPNHVIPHRVQPVITPSVRPSSPPVIIPVNFPSIAAPSSPPAKKSYQLALFVGNDSQSQQLLQWFDRDPQLVHLRSKCEFQVYTASNTLYRARFAEIVPVSQFPVVLFQDSTGGHIHAAGRTMIPGTAAELYGDLRQGYGLYQQARQAQKTGAIKAAGYSWDDSITPTMSLYSQDCPDGICPTEPSDRWRPGSRVRDTLFDEARDTRDAFIRASANELATIALCVIAVLLLGFILIKRGV